MCVFFLHRRLDEFIRASKTYGIVSRSLMQISCFYCRLISNGIIENDFGEMAVVSHPSAAIDPDNWPRRIIHSFTRSVFVIVIMHVYIERVRIARLSVPSTRYFIGNCFFGRRFAKKWKMKNWVRYPMYSYDLPRFTFINIYKI